MRHFKVGSNALDWWSAQSGSVREQLRRSGVAVLDTEGVCSNVDAFREFANAVCGRLVEDNPEHERIEGHEADGRVNRPTPFAKDRKLLWHNENTFARMWPRRIMFGCRVIGEGGATPTADMSAVYERLDNAIQVRFARLGVTYIRRLGMDVGLDWRTVYRTDDRSEVEAACTAQGATWSWDNDGEVLITRERRPAVVRNPESGRMAVVAQVLHWHPRALDPDIQEAMSTLYEPGAFPKTCRFGDDSEIPDFVVDQLRRACAAVEETVEWQPNRVMVLDNLRRSHARNPYDGPRELMVAIGDTTDSGVLWGA